MLSADPLPRSDQRARVRRQSHGLRDQSAFLRITSWSPSTPVPPWPFGEPRQRTLPALVTPEFPYRSFCRAFAKAMRAILLASATATSLKGFFSMSFLAHNRSGSVWGLG
jgi:hypothetical protein